MNRITVSQEPGTKVEVDILEHGVTIRRVTNKKQYTAHSVYLSMNELEKLTEILTKCE